MIPKDMKLAIQILDKLNDEEIGMINDMIKWKIENVFDDIEDKFSIFGNYGETITMTKFRSIKKRHLSNYEPIGSSLNKDYKRLKK